VEALLESFESIPKSFAPAEKDRYEDNVHLVDQVSLEELADRAGAAADSHVEVAGESADLLERFGGLKGASSSCPSPVPNPRTRTSGSLGRGRASEATHKSVSLNGLQSAIAALTVSQAAGDPRAVTPRLLRGEFFGSFLSLVRCGGSADTLRWSPSLL
jgi:hypothetical protein